jgi:RND family efflux transporter MFP subunit
MRRQTLSILVVTLLVLAAGTTVVWRWRMHRVSTPDAHADMPAATTASQPPSAPTAIPRGDVSLDLRRQQLIGVRTVKATRGPLNHVIRAVGVVRADETRVVDVNVKLDGWIRELSADYTGRFVREGEGLFTLYSPDLLATEQEYVLALSTRDALQSSVMPDAKARADALVAAARQRLALWDLSPADLDRLAQNRQAGGTNVVHAPVTGYVTDKAIVKGAHVTAGQTLLKLADLSVVWVEADLYGQEAPLVQLNSRAAVTLDAYPGERISGRAIYLVPSVDEQTRTSRVRYAFPNPRGRLRPGMYATVEIEISGGVGVTLPLDAVLDSGREQIVFVAQGDGYFAPRAVKIGRRLGGVIEILEGLGEGEEVASGATFLLDSESQLRGALQGYSPTPSTSSPAPQPADRLQILLRTTPDPPTTGENQFEVSITNSTGGAVADADVSVQLFMPAMPTMNMPAMRNEVKLSPAGNGLYRGTGQIMMAGRWDATVTAFRAGLRLGSSQTTVVAR